MGFAPGRLRPSKRVVCITTRYGAICQQENRTSQARPACHHEADDILTTASIIKNGWRAALPGRTASRPGRDQITWRCGRRCALVQAVTRCVDS